MTTKDRNASHDEINECRHLLCLLFREYRIVIKAFPGKSLFHKRFLKLKNQTGLTLLKYSEADSRVNRAHPVKSWWLRETYMPLQLELDIHQSSRSISSYREKLCHLLKDIYENLDRSLNELDHRKIKTFKKNGQASRDATRYEVYNFLEDKKLKPKTSRAWEIHNGLKIIPGGRT